MLWLQLHHVLRHGPPAGPRVRPHNLLNEPNHRNCVAGVVMVVVVARQAVGEAVWVSCVLRQHVGAQCGAAVVQRALARVEAGGQRERRLQGAVSDWWLGKIVKETRIMMGDV